MLELMWKEKAKRAKKNQKGFTLVELIVVVAILGILAVIGITRFAGLTDNARHKADIATAASLASAAQVYIANQPTAPATGVIAITALTGANLVDAPGNSRTSNTAFVINYDAGTKKLTVVDTNNQWYPAPKGDKLLDTAGAEI